jgi:hypothetical protein
MGVQPSLNLADSQSRKQCTHVVVRANGGSPPPLPPHGEEPPRSTARVEPREQVASMRTASRALVRSLDARVVPPSSSFACDARCDDHSPYQDPQNKMKWSTNRLSWGHARAGFSPRHNCPPRSTLPGDQAFSSVQPGAASRGSLIKKKRSGQLPLVCFCSSCSRRTLRWIFPDKVFGSS